MLFKEPKNLKLATFTDLFTGETEEELKLIPGIRYHVKHPVSSIWSTEKTTGEDMDHRTFLTDFNAEKIYIVYTPVKIKNPFYEP